METNYRFKEKKDPEIRCDKENCERFGHLPRCYLDIYLFCRHYDLKK